MYFFGVNMNIKEYVKKQSTNCKNEIMKEIFIDLVDKFFPKPKPQTYNTTAITSITNAMDKLKKNTVFSRRVLVKTPGGKNYVGLIDEDGYNIKLPNNKTLEYQLVCHSQTGTFTYYSGLDNIFFREKDSRIIKAIELSNFLEHRSNIYWCFKYMSPTEVAKYKKMIGEMELDEWLNRYDRENKS